MAASEGVPFSKTGGLADVVGALPAALTANGVEVAVVLPRYKETKLSKPKTLIPSLTIPLGDGLHFPSIIEESVPGSVRWFFVEYPAYFGRDSLYVVPGGTDYADNPERFALFSRAVIEIAKSVFPPDLIHCHDWQAGLLPVLLKSVYATDAAVNRIPTIVTVHNLGYQGQFAYDALHRAGLPLDLFHVDRLEFYLKVNFLKGALVYCDAITTVSKKYSQEIQTPEYGFGLDGVLRDRAERITGILNGVDYSQWDPSHDTNLAAPYSAADLEGKKACKKDLLRQFGMSDDDLSSPVIGIVSRFAAQKGFDLIADIAERMVGENARLVVLGNGDAKYEKLFLNLAARYKNKVGVRVAYDDALAHKIEGGADMFLMPSRYEPCGLNQIYSLRYGTVPIVRATGGLDDTIEDYQHSTGAGTGFKFSGFTGTELLETVLRALSVYAHDAEWKKLMRNGMAKDFSWNASAREYVQLYGKVAGVAGIARPSEVSPDKSPAGSTKRTNPPVRKAPARTAASTKKKVRSALQL